MDEEQAFSVDRFCERNDISKTTYLKNRAAGMGPVELRLPGSNIVRVSLTEERAWQKRWEHPSPEDAALIDKERSRLHKRAAHAVSRREDRKGA